MVVPVGSAHRRVRAVGRGGEDDELEQAVVRVRVPALVLVTLALDGEETVRGAFNGAQGRVCHAAATNGEEHRTALSAAEEVTEGQTLRVRPLLVLARHGLAGVQNLVEPREEREDLGVRLRAADVRGEERGEFVQAVEAALLNHVYQLVRGEGHSPWLDRACAILE